MVQHRAGTKTDERAVADFIEGLIQTGRLHGSIERVNEPSELLEFYQRRSGIPTVSIDGFQRQRLLESMAAALEALKGDLDFVTRDHSVSKRRGEGLKPDFVLFNRSQGKIILVEVKNDEQPEREAVTELLAYEREVLNHFPFLAHSDVVFVLIARNWDTLLRHSYAQLSTFHGRAIAGLVVNGNTPDLRLSAKTDEAWSDFFILNVPPEALITRTYALGEMPGAREAATVRLSAAAHVMGSRARQCGVHGFALVSIDAKTSFGECTIALVDPSWFYRNVDRFLTAHRDSEFTAYFDRFLSTSEFPQEDLFARLAAWIANALNASNESIRVTRQGTWPQILPDLKRSCEPVRFSFWGLLDEFASSISMSPVARSYFCEDAMDLERPVPGFHLLQAATATAPISGGILDVRSLFNFGRLLGERQAQLRQEERSETDALWNAMLLRPYVAEIAFLSATWVDTGAAPQMSFKGASKVKLADEQVRWIEWFEKDVLAESVHLHVFRAGMEFLSAARMHAELAHAGIYVGENACSGDGANPTISALDDALVDAAQNIKALRLRQCFLADTRIDVAYLRRGISAIRLAHKDGFPCIVLGGDGFIGTTMLEPAVNLPTINHEEQVAVVDFGSEDTSVYVMPWDDLSDGNLDVIAQAAFVRPLELRAWRSSWSKNPPEVLDNRWKRDVVDLNDLFVYPRGGPGARFMRFSHTFSSPLEIGVLINLRAADARSMLQRKPLSYFFQLQAERGDQGLTAVLLLEVRDREGRDILWSDGLEFDPCDGRTRLALLHFVRQKVIHFIIADEDGTTYEFVELPTPLTLANIHPLFSVADQYAAKM